MVDNLSALVRMIVWRPIDHKAIIWSSDDTVSIVSHSLNELKLQSSTINAAEFNMLPAEDHWLCFYQRVLTDPPRIILCLIPFFILSNRISAIFDPARWSQWDQRWTTSEGGLILDPIGIKGYFGFTTVYFTHKMTK